MTLPTIDLLLSGLSGGGMGRALTMTEWDILVRQCRAADLLGRVAAAWKDQGKFDEIPIQPRMHFASASNLANRQFRELRWETEQIRDALTVGNFPVVLLKGAAYAMAGLNAAKGRMVSDIDILVSREHLGGVESALMKRGWVSSARSGYDERYYRTWMHELPPMTHFKRGTVIDVHHAILPLTAKYHPSTKDILQATVSVPHHAGLMMLSPVDMVLHSASHLFHEGEFEQGLRGLLDIDQLLAEFGNHFGFWDALVPRAIDLQLSKPLFYALRYSTLLLGTKIPASVTSVLSGSQSPSLTRAGLFAMDALFLRALRPAHPSTSDRWTGIARWLLFVRSHWMRMPPSLLAIHLSRKAWMRAIPAKSRVT